MRERGREKRTSFRATGFSNKDKWVNLPNFPNGSKSANSTKLLEVSTKVVRLGIEVARFCWTLFTLFLANNRVLSRGESGKFEIIEMSLSVKSMASCCPATARFSIVGIL